MLPRVCAAIVLPLFLASCSVLESNMDGQASTSNRGPFDASPNSPDAAERVRTMEVSTEVPQVGARQTGRHRGMARTDCNDDNDVQAAYSRALEDLRIKAANDGADCLRVLGSGPLDERGFCTDDYYRLNGVGFLVLNQNAGMTEGSNGNSVDSLTGRLEELDSLRSRGLITDGEYEQLREQVLNDAY